MVWNSVPVEGPVRPWGQARDARRRWCQDMPVPSDGDRTDRIAQQTRSGPLVLCAGYAVGAGVSGCLAAARVVVSLRRDVVGFPGKQALDPACGRVLETQVAGRDDQEIVQLRH